jgi:hypothetical protein
MRPSRYMLVLALLLVVASGLVCLIAYDIYGKAEEIGFWLLMETAFVPIQVLLVGLIIERLLALHEKRQLLHKMNMVIGVFFSELGTRLLGDLTPAVANRGDILTHLGVQANWKTADFRNALDRAAEFDYRIDLARLDLAALKTYLSAKRDLVVLLLANPNLMEHERFTDLLWAVSHLMEELAARPSLAALPDADRDHLAGDVKRVYERLVGEWLRYCRHLQLAYPYIFSLTVRTHPLQEAPSATISG